MIPLSSIDKIREAKETLDKYESMAKWLWKLNNARVKRASIPAEKRQSWDEMPPAILLMSIDPAVSSPPKEVFFDYTESMHQLFFDDLSRKMHGVKETLRDLGVNPEK
jgi:hypothetical protein